MSVEELLAQARDRFHRLTPEQAWDALAAGALVVDIRPGFQREHDGEVPGAVVVGRNVLEWRLEPGGVWRMPEAPEGDALVVLLCDQGCATQLAAASLLDLGCRNVSDVIGGFQAWLEAGLPTAPAGTCPDRTLPGPPSPLP